MVFEEHHNGVPIAWVISSRNNTDDICKWMSTLIVAGKKKTKLGCQGLHHR